ncbi:hypothetical protein VA596_04280 [Amycolatopsis sp., V23-08]|uniref:FXSXX-COOH protein n=1 Tax=Amycolatopsis heterodermiae TaxID=3110235 RepID=A0ABU5QXT7_9PSEU|nr:hypothetical protein [Amycolatopsis sp., V23-08]MEA5358742.1 hypothetical protein [Amycolatopsis sp., V23-08]
MADVAGQSSNRVRVILPHGLPELTPAVARSLLAVLLELSDKKLEQAAKSQQQDREPLI